MRRGKSDDLLKRDFTFAEPLKKCVTDIIEIKAKDGKLYVSAIFDCFDTAVLGLAMDTNMKASLCERTPDNAVHSYPALRAYRSLSSDGILIKKVSTNIDNIMCVFEGQDIDKGRRNLILLPVSLFYSF